MIIRLLFVDKNSDVGQPAAWEQQEDQSRFSNSLVALNVFAEVENTQQVKC